MIGTSVHRVIYARRQIRSSIARDNKIICYSMITGSFVILTSLVVGVAYLSNKLSKIGLKLDAEISALDLETSETSALYLKTSADINDTFRRDLLTAINSRR